jgi:hypothetical protein
MKRKQAGYLLLASFASVFVLLFPASPVTHSEKSTATVKVDCTKGDQINKALVTNLQVAKLAIEISGMCHENVIVTRDGVTLHGTDPANDGIQAVANTEVTDAALWVRAAASVTVENLTLTGGFSGLFASNANIPVLRLTNCRLVGNTTFGLHLQNSVANAADTTFEAGANAVPAGLFIGSRLGCGHCTLIAPASGANNTLTVVSSTAVFGQQSTFTGGPVRADNSSVLISDSSIDVSAPNVPSVNSITNTSFSMTRVQITGRMFFGQGSIASLNAVTQTLTGTQPNQATMNSHVTVGSAGQPTGGPPNINSNLANFDLNNFANLVLSQGSTIDGNLTCRSGSDAFCANPADVTGQTNCGKCPKP